VAQNRKHWKEVLAQLEARIEEHWRKIREEEVKPRPNWGLSPIGSGRSGHGKEEGSAFYGA
jgi:hypothetical protein